jgi:hypothetical protein
MPVGISRLPPGASAPSTGNDHLTSPSLLVALGALKPDGEGGYVLGRDPYQTDPCASMRQPWPTARTMWTEDMDGMAQDWSDAGELFLNSPYGTQMPAWLGRLADHGNGTALVYARTDTIAFYNHVWQRADAVYFFGGRIFFHSPVTGIQYSANAGGPCCLVLYGAKSVERAKRLLKPGSAYPGSLVPIQHGKRLRVVETWSGVKKAKPKVRRKAA